MKRILLTGMSGTGKSTLIRALRAKGYKAIDADEGYSQRGPEGDWLWDEAKVAQLLDTEDAEVLFLSGCATNQGRFYSRFDEVILLSAPESVLVQRIGNRTDNSYGKSPDELAEVLENLRLVEPLLRRGATHEVRTDGPFDSTLQKLLECVTGKAEGNEGQ